jgi:signal transduction histidine kinase
MAVPIRKMGKAVGFLVADVNMRGVWDIVDSVMVGKTGKAFLLSDTGLLIAHPDKKRVVRNENFLHDPAMMALIQNKKRVMESSDGWVRSMAPVGGIKWTLVLEQEQREAFLPVRILRLQLLIIFILSVFGSGTASFFASYFISRPIEKMLFTIRGMESGAEFQMIKPNSRDAMGEVVRSLNSMIQECLRARKQERLVSIGEATAWVAHELKNCLVPIKAFVQLFPRKHMDSSFVETFGKLIPGEIARWERMLKNLNDYSSPTDVYLRKTNVGEMLQGTIDLIRLGCEDTAIQISYIAPDEPIYVMLDAERMRQVVMNLCTNALQAMESGSGLLEISVSVSEPQEDFEAREVVIVIRDTGKGMPADVLGKIFDPFYTTRSQGMGLGLTISRRIIQEHRGMLKVQSEISKGTTFFIRLPKDSQSAIARANMAGWFPLGRKVES